MNNPTKRFADRVDNYVKFRPHYPSAITNCLEQDFDFDERKIVADIGSGTGISTELFLRNGNHVFGVEPNDEMRVAGERLLGKYKQFVSVDGTSEATTLEDGSVDVIAAGQAFHWFDREKTKREFKRIARSDAHAVLMWNDRVETTSFMHAYEEFVQQFATDYNDVNHKNVGDSDIEEFFSPLKWRRYDFSHERVMDFEELKGLLLSSSYMPNESHPRFGEMIVAMRELFSRYQNNGVVKIEYVARVYCGRVH